MDKSETHVRVMKNGIEDWMSKNTIETLGGIEAFKKHGWEVMPTEPIEVQVLRSKKAEIVADAPEGTIESIEPLKTKSEVEEEVEEVSDEPKKRKYNKRK